MSSWDELESKAKKLVIIFALLPALIVLAVKLVNQIAGPVMLLAGFFLVLRLCLAGWKSRRDDW